MKVRKYKRKKKDKKMSGRTNNRGNKIREIGNKSSSNKTKTSKRRNR
jgi:hypothetical protein